MSSFYDDASLVVIPSGYKTSKVYAEKPTDGSGDLAFTRTGDTATRVNSAGLIEKVRTNLVLQSEAFNTTWVPSRGAVTANATTAPNGTTTADKFVPDTQVNPHFVSQAISGLTSGGIYTCSVYAKLAEWNSLAIFRGDSAIGVNFRLDTQAMTVLAGSPVTYSITDAGNGWYRCSMSFAIASTSDGAQFRVGNNSNYSIAGNNANGLFLWGAQYEATDFGATAYIPTTTAAVSTGPVANVPRLDYLDSTCPRLLLEPQRSNLITFSEQLDNAAWTKSETTVAANLLVSPDAYTNADTVSETTASNQHYAASSAVSFLASTKYTATVYAKWDASCTRNLHIRLGNCASVNIGASFDKNGNFVNYTGGANGTLDAYSFTNVGNGWLRFSVTITTAATASSGNGIWLYTLQGTAVNFAGSTSQKISYWGAQVEAGAYATSYIPTLAASATRGADVATKTGITSLIGQTEGTIFVDFQTLAITSSNHSIFGVETASTHIVRLVQDATTANLRGQVYLNTGGTNLNITTTFPLVVGTRYKAAFAYKSGSFAIYVNGTSVATSTAAVTFPTLSAVSLNNYLAVATNDGGRMTKNQLKTQTFLNKPKQKAM